LIPLLIHGLVYGLLATIPMTIFEIIPYTRFGIIGVFEWHENFAIISMFRKTGDKVSIFLLHFINGALAALPYPYLIEIFGLQLYLPRLIFSAMYGLFVWLVTLLPIHKPLTGFNPFKHPLGSSPLCYSLAGHVIYGLGLGVVSICLG
jgi:hypothetical protein